VAKVATFYFGKLILTSDVLAQFVKAEPLIRLIIRDIHGELNLGYHEFFDSQQWITARNIFLTRQEHKTRPIELERLLWRFRFQEATYRQDMIRTMVGMAWKDVHESTTSQELFLRDMPDALIPTARL